MKTISIIVPCYNEEEALHILYEELAKYLDEKYKWYIVFIDDGSKDKTMEIVKSFANKDDRIKYLSFSRNFGKEAAMFAGLQMTKKLKSDAAILIDADLQDPPSLIPQMLEYYEQGYKHIYGKHSNRKGQSFLKKVFSNIFYKVYAFLTNNKDMAKGSRDFCLLDKAVIEAFISFKDYQRFTKGIFTWVGFEKKCLEFDYSPRSAGTTKWSFRKLFKYAMLGITQFSRVILWLPNILLVLLMGLTIFDVVYGIINTFNLMAIRLDLFMISIMLVLKYVIKLGYDIRDQGLNRPIYIANDTNITDGEE